jgi:hypothetical protein
VLASFVVMLVGVNLAFVAYGIVYTAVTRWSGAATAVVCPWPWPSAKVYDPQGFYEKSGAPGPFSEGIWSSWESAQPDGRPVLVAPPPGARCLPDSHHQVRSAAYGRWALAMNSSDLRTN